MKFSHLFVLFLSFLISCSSSETTEPPLPENPASEEEDNQVDDTADDNTTGDDTTGEDIIVWENWYLSVPINNGNDKATSIFYTDIINDALSPQEAEYFYKNDDGTYTMFTKFTGYTTSGYSELGDKYCRTELREFWQGNQDTNDNWFMNEGTHILETTLDVDFVEGNGRTIVAQIHGKETEGLEGSPATVKIRWNSGMIQLDHYVKPDAGEPWTSEFDTKKDVARVDNEIFTFKLKVEDGKCYYALICEAKDINIDYTLMYDYVGNGYAHWNYFKTGNYFGWHDDYEKTAQVTLRKVVTEHY